MTKEQWMKKAIAEAKKASLKYDEVPIGCVIVHNDRIIARGSNRRETKQQAAAHAEMEAIAKACRKLGTWRLDDCDLYVTLEPCPMCTGAIIQSRIRNVYFGAYDPKGGCMGSCTNLLDVPGFNHYPSYEGGILQSECSEILSDFFREKRRQKKRAKKRGTPCE